MRTPPHFNRYGLPEDVTALLNSAESIIKDALEKQTDSIIDIGDQLVAVKARLGHGFFGPWIDTTFRFSRRTAENYMSVHTKLGEHKELMSQFSPVTLYLLSASAADKHRKKVLGEIKSGKLRTDEDVRQRLGGLAPTPAEDPESVKVREANLDEAVTLLTESTGSALPRLIELLKKVGIKELTERLERARLHEQDQAA